MADTDACAPTNASDNLGLRIGSIFVIGVGAMAGALFPVLARRSRILKVPQAIFDFAKYFGSGVIIATAFIHLLDPALDELSSPCLSPAWQEYPYALALAMFSIFAIFIMEIIAFRWGTAKLQALGIKHDPHGHGVGGHAAHGPESNGSPEQTPPESTDASLLDVEKQAQTASHQHEHRHSHDHGHADGDVGTSPLAQLVGIAILEFGVMLHSVLIGLTLAVSQNFEVLFVVLVFHQTFEGLGLGARLAYTQLPGRWGRLAPPLAAIAYGVATPLGIAVGLGIRNTYAPGGATASIVSGVLDALSAGILIYTGLVELLAHEFLFNKEMINGSNAKLAYAVCSMLLGCGVMALLGRWA